MAKRSYSKLLAGIVVALLVVAALATGIKPAVQDAGEQAENCYYIHGSCIPYDTLMRSIQVPALPWAVR